MTEELKRRLTNKSPAFRRGYDAGGALRDNPYRYEKPFSEERYQAWEDGWLSKFYGETL